MISQNLFEIDLTVGSYQEYLDESISVSGYSCFLNSHMTYEFYNKPGFSEVLKNAKFVVPDGMPALYTTNYFNKTDFPRIAGNDVIFSLFEIASQRGLRVFLVGSTEEVLNIISKKLDVMGVIHESYSPPFRPIEEFDFEDQARRINNFKADIVLVGLGCPKQEIWMFQLTNRIKAHMYGVGGAFLLFAGIDSRAPKLMRDLSLEWLYRMFLEPKRLFKRYFQTNRFFIYLFLREKFFKKPTM